MADKKHAPEDGIELVLAFVNAFNSEARGNLVDADILVANRIADQFRSWAVKLEQADWQKDPSGARIDTNEFRSETLLDALRLRKKRGVLPIKHRSPDRIEEERAPGLLWAEMLMDAKHFGKTQDDVIEEISESVGKHPDTVRKTAYKYLAYVRWKYDGEPYPD